MVQEPASKSVSAHGADLWSYGQGATHWRNAAIVVQVQLVPANGHAWL